MVDSETIDSKISDKKEEFDEKKEETKEKYEETKEQGKTCKGMQTRNTPNTNRPPSKPLTSI